jgi:hypothetical protein
MQRDLEFAAHRIIFGGRDPRFEFLGTYVRQAFLRFGKRIASLPDTVLAYDPRAEVSATYVGHFDIAYEHDLRAIPHRSVCAVNGLARFAFLLGAFSILVSSVLTGGVGPWLPFQMFALGWVGAGAGLLRIVARERFPVIVLGVYAYASSIAYGFVMTLWFWPFLGQGGPAFFADGLGLVETVVRYLRFYSLTSLPWDTGRALLSNVPLVVILCRPIGTLFERVRERFVAEIVYV